MPGHNNHKDKKKRIITPIPTSEEFEVWKEKQAIELGTVLVPEQFHEYIITAIIKRGKTEKGYYYDPSLQSFSKHI